MQNLIYFAHVFNNMPRHKIQIPVEDVHYKLKGLKTLVEEGKTQEGIAEYYKSKGIEVDRSTISRRIREL